MWVNRDNRLGERGQTYSHCDFIYMKCLELANPQRQKTGPWVPGAAGRDCLMCISLYGDENVVGLDSGDDCTTL